MTLNYTQINKLRLINQQIAAPVFDDAGDLVYHMLGMQAQDYQMSKWAIALRLNRPSTDSMIEDEIAAKKIVRCWPMRGTLHFVSGRDVHWILDLLQEKRLAANQFRYRQLGLDKKLLNKCSRILENILEGGNQLTRDDIKSSFFEKGIKLDGVQVSHVLYNAGAEKLICFGNRRGKQFTYTLLDEWVPEKRKLSREKSIAEFALRYFRSRGPATIKDFQWWSGLTLTESRTGLESVKHQLQMDIKDGEQYWFNPETGERKINPVYLLPAFDEYLIAYKNRSSSLDPDFEKRLIFINGMFFPMIVIKGKVSGTWKRIIKKDKVELELNPFVSLNKTQTAGLNQELKRYQVFMEKKAEIRIFKSA